MMAAREEIERKECWKEGKRNRIETERTIVSWGDYAVTQENLGSYQFS